MKNKFCYNAFLLLGVLSSEAKSTIDESESYFQRSYYSDSLISFLKQLNVGYYYGKAVDSLLAAIPAVPSDLKVYSNPDSRTRLNLASELTVSYSNGAFLRIYVTQFRFMNPYSAALSRDVSVFRKETIFRVDIYQDAFTCINGWCKNP